VTERPTIGQQAEAVEWAKHHAPEMAKRAKVRDGETIELYRRLEAAAETLRTLEFGREALK
jgi:hypothetical protein